MDILGLQIRIAARDVQWVEIMRCRIDQIGVVRTADARRVAQLHLTRIIDVVGDEPTREHAVVRVVVRRARRLQVKVCRGALDTDASLEQNLAALRVENPVGGVDDLVVREIADAGGIGQVRRLCGVEDLGPQGRVKALHRSAISGFETQQTRERPHVVEFQRVLVWMLPANLALQRRRVARRAVRRERARDDGAGPALARPHDAELARQLVTLLREPVFVRERRLEIELVVRAPGEPVAEPRERARRVQITVQKPVRLRLGARAVVHVRRQLVLPAQLIAGAPGERVRERHLRAQPRFLEIGQRRLVGVGAKDRVAPRPVIPQEAVAAIERQRTAFVAEVAPHVHVASCAATDRESAAPRFIRMLLQDDVDDPRHAFGVFACRRVGNDLDLVHHVGRQLREVVAELRGLQRAGSAVDLEDHVGVAAQAHDVVDVHVHGRHIAQHVERGAAAGGGHVADGVGGTVGSQLHVALLARHLQRLQHDRRRRERHGSQVDARRCRADFDGEDPRRVPQCEDADSIASGRKVLNVEAAVRVGGRVGAHSTSGVHHFHRGDADRRPAGGTHHAAADFAAVLCDRHGLGREDQQYPMREGAGRDHGLIKVDGAPYC